MPELKIPKILNLNHDNRFRETKKSSVILHLEEFI